MILIAAMLLTATTLNIFGIPVFQKHEIFINGAGQEVTLSSQGYQCLYEALAAGKIFIGKNDCIDNYGYIQRFKYTNSLIALVILAITYVLVFSAIKFNASRLSLLLHSMIPKGSNRKIACIALGLVSLPATFQLLIYDLNRSTIRGVTSICISISFALIIIAFTPILQWLDKK
ncbi:hypothetical protein G6666_07685 [Polynucleobacter paneuropaeus]|nr:hypothetical protein [Polynucleobacter paneuropaeus]